MSIIDQITELMLREGEIKAQQARERIASEEEQRQAKHRVLKTTLKTLATFGPLFLPGAPLGGLLGSKWAALGMSPFEKYLMASLNGGSKAASVAVTSPGRVPAGLGYTTFTGPMTHTTLPLPSRQTVPPYYIPPSDDDEDV